MSYVACGNTTSGNLAPPPSDAAKDTPQEALVANLAPPPIDSGIDANDSSTTDAADATNE